jgi:inosine-uridine nucleoside N-ribohydrolase
MVNIIFDTDPGSDDAVALAVLAANFKNQIAALVSTYGNSDGETTFRNLVNLAALLGIGAEIIHGSDARLDGTTVAGSLDGYHGKYALCGVKLADAPFPKQQDDFIQRLYEKIVAAGRVTYIAVGPLTNLAFLLTRYPDARAHIAETLIMGGGLSVFNAPHRAEYNFAIDPRAVAAVLKSVVNIKLFPLDTTTPLCLTKEEVAAVARTDSLIAQILHGNYETAVRHNEKGAIIHDATPLLYLRPDTMRSERAARVNVDEHGHIFYSDSGYPISIVEGFDKKQFQEMLCRSLS